MAWGAILVKNTKYEEVLGEYYLQINRVQCLLLTPDAGTSAAAAAAAAAAANFQRLQSKCAQSMYNY